MLPAPESVKSVSASTFEEMWNLLLALQIAFFAGAYLPARHNRHATLRSETETGDACSSTHLRPPSPVSGEVIVARKTFFPERKLSKEGRAFSLKRGLLSDAKALF